MFFLAQLGSCCEHNWLLELLLMGNIAGSSKPGEDPKLSFMDGILFHHPKSKAPGEVGHGQ